MLIKVNNNLLLFLLLSHTMPYDLATPGMVPRQCIGVMSSLLEMQDLRPLPSLTQSEPKLPPKSPQAICVQVRARTCCLLKQLKSLPLHSQKYRASGKFSALPSVLRSRGMGTPSVVVEAQP